MFKAVIDNSKLFKDSINLINELVGEGIFEISTDGIKLVAMDPASVAMIVFHLLPSAFSTYTVDESKKIGLSIDKLKDVLRRVTGTERIIISLVDANLLVEIQDTYHRKFSLPLLDLDPQDLRVPALEFNAVVELKSDVLKNGVEDAGVLSDSIILHAFPEKFVMSGRGDNSDVTIELDPTTSDALVNLDVKEESSAKYSIEYLNKMIKASKLAENLTLNFKKDYPLRLDYTSVNQLKVSFILAPRVETD
ncbi:proliferating cell nuclear antigen (pcna) [archaeon CG10_big_fil_rev_8_21_14_0_10_43_11]|nr:MAG: proliferating cell nuclear antigen (pcna) [archaeon CG10_big_fil_rev_8_21_14_0_10_43_11]